MMTSAGAMGGAMAFAQLGSAFASASAQRTQADYAEMQARMNARMARLKAKQVKEIGTKEARKHEKSVKELKGSQKAALAAQGISIDSGSAADTLDETELLGKLEVETIKNNSLREAFGYEQQATSDLFAGEMASIKGKYGSQQTLLGGATSAATSYLSFQAPSKSKLKVESKSQGPVNNNQFSSGYNPSRGL